MLTAEQIRKIDELIEILSRDQYDGNGPITIEEWARLKPIHDAYVASFEEYRRAKAEYEAAEAEYNALRRKFSN
ncbi:MAG: hypothetical protein HY459_00350 [Parcubacteria group bacterium]|nr:hypothetical protein [Parcubacteria group bacterium]